MEFLELFILVVNRSCPLPLPTYKNTFRRLFRFALCEVYSIGKIEDAVGFYKMTSEK